MEPGPTLGETPVGQRPNRVRAAYGRAVALGGRAKPAARVDPADPVDPVDPAARRGLLPQLASFAAVGVASTLAYLGLFLLLRPQLGPQAANALSLLITAVANTALNRRFTFGVRGRTQAGVHQFQGLIVFALALGLTSGTLAAAHAVDSNPPVAVEVVLLVFANGVATLLRFVLLRRWVFREP
jgi:putative flippase GtrA